MDDTERLKKAFDFAQDSTKQILTLASAIVALTITFYKDFAPAAGTASRHLMEWSWVLYAVSILLGLVQLFQLTGALVSTNAAEQTPTNLSAKITSGGQQITFFIGLVLTVIAGWLAVGDASTTEKTTPPIATTSARSTAESPHTAPSSTITQIPTPTSATAGHR
ncbi:MAG: hypothetical protein WCE30_10860 [Mycobacterium sp.]